MSFPEWQGYSRCHPPPSNEENGYGETRQSAAPANHNTYLNNTRRGQYGQSGHNWSSHSPQDYHGVHGETRSYRDGSWGPTQNQSATYNYQGRQTSYSASSSHESAAPTYHPSASQAPGQSSTHALNNLAYASGLESAVIQFPSNHENHAEATAQSVSRGSQNTRYAPASVESLPQNTLQQYQHRNNSTPYQTYRERSGQPPQQRLAASAAAALAGAVSRRYSSVQQSPGPSSSQPLPNTVAVGNTPSTTSPLLTQNQQRSRTPQVTPAIQASHKRPDSATTQQTPNSRGNYSAAHTHSSAVNGTSERNSGQHASDVQGLHAVQDLVQRQPRRSPETSKKTAQQTSSIANLVTNDASHELDQTVHHHDQASTALPGFIDPTQVFNPYHKEYERQKREAEAHANAQSTMVMGTVQHPGGAAGQSKVPVYGEKTVPEGNGSLLREGKEASTSDKNNKNTMHSSSEARIGEDALVVEAASSKVKPADEDIASEMQAMVERMREWKSKDPTLFHMLLEHVTKGRAGVPATSASTTVRSQQFIQAYLPQPLRAATRAKSLPDHAPQVDQTSSKEAQGAFVRDHNRVKVVVENNWEGLPDLGRFPAQRRSRGPYNKRTPQGSAGPPTTSQPQLASPQTTQKQASLGPPSNMDLSSVAPPVASAPSQNLPQAPSSVATVWPEEKRKCLAEAAVQALNANPENRGKMINPDLIHDMLEKNPSYIDLCKMLEDRGFKFQRGQFARQLLGQVPELTKSRPQHAASQPAKTDSPLSPISAVPTPSHPSPFPFNTVQPQTHISSSAGGPIKPETPLPSTPSNSLKATSKGKSNKPRLGVFSPNVPTPAPGSKEAMARKRDFSELVDLTQLSEDEDYVMPSKRPRLEEPSPEPPNFEMKSKPMLSTLTGMANGFAPAPAPGMPGSSNTTSPLRFNAGQSLSASQPSTHASQTSHRARTLLAKSLDKTEALRKSYYDPKTVARDILIAAGRHPTERPLNAHLAGLLGTHIELDSDLSTLDWDAVDPGGPPMPRVMEADVPAGPPRWRLGERRGRVSGRPGVEGEPSRDKPQASPTISAMHSSLARLSSHTRSLLQESQVPMKSSASQPSRLRQSHAVDGQDEDGLTTAPHKHKAPSTASPTSSRQHPPNHNKQTPDNNKAMEPRRRGRPPGSKNKHSSVELLKKAVKVPIAQVSDQNRAASLSPSPPPPLIYECHWHMCNAKLHNLPTLRKHISRMHKPENNDLIKHGYSCWWKKCQYLKRQEDRTFSATKQFELYADWLDHIERDHLHPIGMDLGDGPSSSIIGKPELALSRFFYHPLVNPGARTCSYTDAQTLAHDRANFLSDERGRAVTASATKAANKKYSPDAMVLTVVSQEAEDRLPVKSFLKVHGNDKMDTKVSALETLRAMEVRKERLGPGIDRGGCTLVNAERRATLLQDEGLARVVDEDY